MLDSDAGEAEAGTRAQSARGDGQRAAEVAEQLTGALADPHVTLGSAAAGAHHHQVAMLARDDPLECTGNRPIRLYDGPGPRRELIADVPQAHLGLLAD